jgi:hypothetical protein
MPGVFPLQRSFRLFIPASVNLNPLISVKVVGEEEEEEEEGG